ncbi:MAG: radical SAM protein [Kiritimatiellae bacterium]|nr:radical SAM protein [Kiritimatiellia bacterium]
MYLAIPRNVYARRYGDFFYLFNQTTWASALIKNAIAFEGVFTRTPTTAEQISTRISNAYQQPYSSVKSDLRELATPLIADGFLLCGKNAHDLWSKPKLKHAPHAESHHETKGEAESPEDLLYAYFRSSPNPFELDIDLTQACTERCIHCYAPAYGAHSLDFKLIEKVFGEFRAMGGLKVKLTGGECMLHTNFVDILKMARAHDFVISVLSNLTVCGAFFLEAIKATDVAVVQTSLYGADAQTHEMVTRLPGSFTKTMNAIKRLRKSGVQVQIHCPLMKQNAHTIEAVRKIGEDLGVKTTFDAAIMARANHDNSNCSCALTDDMLVSFLQSQRILDKYTGTKTFAMMPDAPVCNIGIARICLSATGDYYPCSGCYEYYLGKCNQMTLCDVWNGERMTRLRSIRFKDMDKCQSCDLLPYCSVCPTRNFNATNSLFIPDPLLCRIAKIKHDLASHETET